MELKWLEDYLALVKYQNFSEAARARHITQPAFSRRIRALESWLDATLIKRDINPIRLTAVGQDFLPKAEKLVNDIYKIHEEARQFTQGQKTISLYTQHSLMVSHVPALIESIQDVLSDYFVRFTANNQQNAVQKFLDNEDSFLLCFVALGLPQRLHNNNQLDAMVMNHDRLLPVTATNKKGKPLYQPKKDTTLRMLSFPRGSFMYRLIEENSLKHAKENYPVQIVFENDLASGLKLMAMKGYGVAWLPESLIVQELKANALAVVEGEHFAPIALDICLYRHQSATSIIGKAFWQSCQSKSKMA